MAVRAASRAPAGRQRRGRRRRKEAVAQRVRRGPRGLPRWVVVQARRALAQEREAAWGRAAARPTGCSRAAESGAQSAVEGRWADRLRLPWRRRRLVRQCRRRPSAPTGCLQSLCLRPTVTTGASWGCLCPANPKVRRPSLARTARERDRREQGPRPGARQLMGLAAARPARRWTTTRHQDVGQQVPAEAATPGAAPHRPPRRRPTRDRSATVLVGGRGAARHRPLRRHPGQDRLAARMPGSLDGLRSNLIRHGLHCLVHYRVSGARPQEIAANSGQLGPRQAH